jgi:hypothetical protein
MVGVISNLKNILLLVLLAGLSTWGGAAYAAACAVAASGNWSAAATWAAPCNVAGGPTAADTVTIPNNNPTFVVTVDVNSAAASITFSGGNRGAQLLLGAGVTLNVTGAITMNPTTSTNAARQVILAVGSGTLTAASVAITGGGPAGRTSQLTVSTGTITIGAITFAGTAANAQLTTTGASTINISGTVSGAGTPTLTATGNTVNYTGAAQTVMASAYYHLGLSGSGAKTMAGVTAIGGDLSISGTATMTGNAAFNVTGALNYYSTGTTTLTAATPISIGSYNQTNGTLVDNGNTITVTGTGANTWSQSAGSFTSTGAVIFTGAAPQIGTATFNNMTLNVGLGNTATLTGNVTLNGVLTLSSGIFTTGANTLEVTSSCLTSISGASATRYVLGNLRLHYPTVAGTTTCTFPIGDATAYTPATVAMTNVSSTLANSTLTASTTTGDHPDTTAMISGIDPAKSVNRYWTLTPGASLTFATYSTTFNFIAGDIDAGANTANFVIARKNTGVWSYPTMGAANPTNTTATGMTQAGGFGQYAIGQTISISGTVFEDFNYGGGAGRSLGASAGVGIGGARVELYTGAGAFVSFTTTSASGTYLFDSLANGTYIVRIASNGATGVRSTRIGGAACATCVPVQTYRTNASSGTPVAVTDHVGGETPTLLDAGDNTTSATLASLTTGTTTAQSITTVTKGASMVTGVDFGFNFDTIVSIRDAGQGSLRQFIVNSNALGGEGSLSQNGLSGGLETSVFMIPNGAAQPGLNAGYANQLTIGGPNAGAAVITLASALPVISGTNTSVDGTTQTNDVGDTNFGLVGTGGTVGVSGIALPRFNRPEVVISAAATQLSGSGSPVYIKGLAVSNGGILVSGANSVVQDCLAGMNADGTVTTVYSATYGIIAGAGTNILISHDYVKVNNSGIRGDSPGANLIIEYSEVDSIDGTPGGGQTNTFDGILIVNSATNITVRYNLVNNQRGGALEFGFGTGAVTGIALENTLLNSGFTSPGVPSTEGMGIAVYSLAAGTALTLQQNIVTGSARVGIAVVPGATALTASGITMTRNSIYGNGTIGIDLNPISSDPNTYTPQGVTLNDLNDADSGPNGLLNFPILESATISGGNLVMTGWARPGSAIELFIADADPSGFGEGKNYLATMTEGSGADTDATVSTYGPGAINGIAQGTDNTNRFKFTIPLPGGVADGTVLTSTATLAGSTSEFSGNVTVTQLPSLTLTKMVNIFWDPVNLGVNPKYIPGALAEYIIIATNSGGPADNNSTVITDPVPANTALYANDIGGVGSGPVLFTNGAAASGLSYTFTALNNFADDVDFSNDNGATWTYVPVPGADGCDTAVTNLRVNPKGIFVGNPVPPNPSFNLRFRVCVK